MTAAEIKVLTDLMKKVPDDITVGRAPEERDTCILGSKYLFWGRVVGNPEMHAEPVAQFFALARTAVPLLVEDLKRAQDAYYKTAHEVEQVLGAALNYPRYCDDPKNFPAATPADGVCVGEHVPETIAAEAAKEIVRLRKELEEWKAAYHDHCRE